jgi:Domain of unknown function (DUF1338)
MSADALDRLLATLHGDYLAMNPQARQVHALLEQRGERIVNDHIALRGLSGSGLDLAALAAPFTALGYVRCGDYAFAEKKLRALHFEHPQADRPRIFISELLIDQLSAPCQDILRRLLAQVPASWTSDAGFLIRGRPWQVSRAEYETLREASEYAAWVAAWGVRVNHFTVSVNHLHSFADLAALNQFLQAQGIALNDAGGLIKGRREDFLQQSSTCAGSVAVAFSDGTLEIPACYVEFAQRFPDAQGRLFSGFIADNANRIFESTDARRPA